MSTVPGLLNPTPGDAEWMPVVTRGAHHNLPDPLTTFIGREAERSALIDLLRRQHVRLVTLTGPGGIGKTRLATEVAREVSPAFRDGVRFVPVESIADPELAKLALAQAVGLPRSVRDVETAIIEVLAEQHTLLLIDNFEQIVACAPFFARLLVAGPDVKMLITSRTPLRVSGEHVFETQPLSLSATIQHDCPDGEARSEAVQLFLARARAANPQMSMDTASLAAMSRICERLDGFPLAIELAAARSNLLKPEAVLLRLDHRLALLTGGARDQPRRLQSLRDAIGWSYDLLDAEEQRLFRALCVFAGGFSLEALDAVAGPELPPSTDTLELLSVLIDSSLVRRNASHMQQNRYAVYETIREFGLDMLRQHGELEALQAQHAAYFVSLAEQIFDLTMMTEPALLDRLDDEQNNFREALSRLLDRGEWDLALKLAGNLSWYWFQRGRVLEGRRWLHRAVGEAPGDVDPGSRCRAVFGLGLLAQASGNVASAKELFEEAARLARETGDDLQLAIATGLLAGALTTLGDFDWAAWLFSENEQRWDADRKPTWMGHAHFHLGLIALGQSDNAEAAMQFAASVAAYDEGNAPLYAVDALQYLGLVALMAGEAREAAQAFDDALNRLELRKSGPDLAMGIANVAALASHLRRPSESVMLFNAANAARDAAGLALPEPAASMYEPFHTRAISALSEAAADDASRTGERMSLETALEIARTVLSGGDVVLSDMQEPADPFGLTEREFDVLRLLGSGKTNDEIARALFISNGTARTHVANILGKFDAHTRTEAAGIARRHGLI